MAKLSYTELKAVVASYVDANKIASDTFTATYDNIVGLTDKIGKIVTLDTIYTIDKLARFDGEFLEFGKTIEEWNEDLILPQNYDSTGANTLAPNDPTYRPVAWSYTLGKKVLKTTLRNNDVERAVNNINELVSIVAQKTKKLQDSYAVFKYQLKREILGKIVDKCVAIMGTNTSYQVSTAYPVGTLLKNSSTIGIVVKAITSTSYATINTWALNVANGYIIPLDLIASLNAPTDTSSGEAFIKQVKEDIEKASDLNEGNSFNGNSLGATEGLVLIVKQGVIPSIEVDTLAGAFNQDRLAIGVETIVVKDFGATTSNAYAILMDSRGFRAHNTYNALRDQVNAEGDFINLVQHTENTAFISNNTFIKIYVPTA